MNTARFTPLWLLLLFNTSFIHAVEPRPVPIVLWSETRTSPRPLAIYVAWIDLTAPGIEPVAVIAPDPDGDGPAESQCLKPMDLAAKQPGLVLAANANAFAEVPRPPKDQRPNWRVGLPLEIVGWARTPEREVSPPQAGYHSFWIDPDGRAHAGNRAAGVPARMAVAGFGDLIRDGRITAGPGGPLHPRTAIGTDATGTTVWLVVVDGRQRGYSEGMTTGELAELMAGLGCTSAINLDGGGSSILIQTNTLGRLQVMNRPSDRAPRPVPVLFGIRRHE